jgi:hypothetical protein
MLLWTAPYRAQVRHVYGISVCSFGDSPEGGPLLGAIAMGLLSDMDDMIDKTDIVLPGACLKVNERW